MVQNPRGIDYQWLGIRNRFDVHLEREICVIDNRSRRMSYKGWVQDTLGEVVIADILPSFVPTVRIKLKWMMSCPATTTIDPRSRASFLFQTIDQVQSCHSTFILSLSNESSWRVFAVPPRDH